MRNRLSFVAWLFIASLTGCVYHQQYPYGYNGYYGNGFYSAPQPQYGYPTAPGNYYTPGTPGTPMLGPGNPTPINGTPSSDPNSGGQPNWNSSPNTYDSGGGNSAPPFNPDQPGGTTGGGSKVPPPGDDPSADRSNSNSPLTPTTSQSARMRSSNYDEQTASFGLENRTEQQPALNNAGTEEVEDAFEEPRVRQVSGNEDDAFQTTQRVPRAVDSSDKPYGHDAQFQWVKGIVEFDEQSGLWVIMYDDNPPTSDTLGGELYLAKHKSLGKLRSGDQILIEGALDNTQTDPRRGLPLFQITRWKKQ